MAELADARVSKTRSHKSIGSTPITRTNRRLAAATAAAQRRYEFSQRV